MDLVLIGIIVTTTYTLIGWLFLLHLKEKTLAVYRAKDMHDNIRQQRLEVDQRILGLLELMRKMMPQTEVKDFVDREFKPVHKTLDDHTHLLNKIYDKVTANDLIVSK